MIITTRTSKLYVQMDIENIYIKNYNTYSFLPYVLACMSVWYFTMELHQTLLLSFLNLSKTSCA